MNINVLDSTIYNRISAGEVVERPSSIVKELVENSIDAGATEITIKIENGGTTLINIVDNGVGIENSEIKKAFLPHATSKIEQINDLDTISTLGFRGEALPSIASVAMVTLKSKSKKDEVGKIIEISAGNISNESECAMNIGTDILVENIFFNTPARKKFLKTNKTEERYISNLVSRLIMTNPDISFTYIADGKKIYQTFGSTLFDAIQTIYGKETTSNLIEIENTFGNFRVKGYIGNYNYSKGNSTYQTIIVNGRFVQNQKISTAVATAYGEKLMKRTYPFFVLELVVPFNFVDVNVHPAKTEVRFTDDRKIFSFIYHSVQDCLINNEIQSNNLAGFTLGENDTNSVIQKDLGIKTEERHYDLSSFEKLKNENQQTNKFSVKEPQQHYYDFSEIISTETLNEPERPLQDFFGDSLNSDVVYSKQDNSNQVEEIPTLTKKEFTGQVIGQLFDTYLLVEDNNEFYLIDQHAVHERILYEDLLKKEDVEIQNLLIPYVFDTNFIESEFLQENLQLLNNMGIGIEYFGGNSFKINSLPLSMINNDLEGFVNSILKNVNNLRNISSKDILKDKLCQTACKSAIKAGYKFNKEQQNALLKYFIDNGMPTHCPHGRPTMIKFTKQEIEKMFKRIV